MITELKVPYLGTAEDDVLLSRWFVAEGESFVRGQVIAAVDTLKASFDVEAAADGVLLRRVVDVGSRVSLQAVIGLLGATGETVPKVELDRRVASLRKQDAAATTPGPSSDDSTSAKPGQARPPKAGAPQASPAARRRARELGVDLSSVKGSGPNGFIRVEDVQVIAPSTGAASGSTGAIAREFLDFLRGNRDAFGALASDFKVLLYRQNGARIGSGVVFEPGAVVLAEHLVLGNDAHFGRGTQVEVRHLAAGDRLNFGAGCRVCCSKITIGDDVSFADGVDIGGRGAFGSEGELVVGNRAQIGERAHLDPSHRIEIGPDAIVARNAMVLTQFTGGNILRGHVVRCQAVVLGMGSHVGAGATVIPGVEIGEDAIVLPNSTVVGPVPPRRMFGGVPAADLQSAGQVPSPAQFMELARGLVGAFARELQSGGGVVELGETSDTVSIAVSEGGVERRLRLGGDWSADDASVLAEDVRVAACVDDEAFVAAASDIVLIDLSRNRRRGIAGPLTLAFCEFLSQRGVRMAES